MCQSPGCGNEAACLGSYEGFPEETYACDSCCGHGNEDGHCRMVEDMERDARAAKVEALEARVRRLEEALGRFVDGAHCYGKCGEGSWVCPVCEGNAALKEPTP